MGSVQNRRDNDNRPFLRHGLPFALTTVDGVIAQDAGRSGDMVPYTVLGKIAASGKYVPLDPTATDGSAIPAGILLDTITEAAIIAGDVLGQTILKGCAVVTEEFVVVEGATTLDTVITVGTNLLLTVRDLLEMRNLFTEVSDDVDDYENS
jgi:hypothetical protein